MRAKLATFILAAALIAPATATAGGFATVGLNPPPEEIGPGTPWVVDLEILQHGRTPLEGVEPSVIVTGGGDREVFPAEPTGKPGVYRAEVVFPGEGTWRYAVDDGFTQTHTFPPVTIGSGDGTAAAGTAAAGAQPDDGGPDIALALAIAAAAGFAAALVVTVVRRRPRPEAG
jgi:hypothetical protein